MDKSNRKGKMVKKHRQFEIYLDYVRRYNVLKLNWVIQKGYTSELNNIWQDMTIKLNDCGGPVRDATHWKKVFTEWKSHTRRKLKYNKPLNEIEKELIDLTGLTSIPERKRKSEKLLKVKSPAEYNRPKVNKENEKNVLKNDIIIKDEILGDWSDTSSTSFMEEEVIDKVSDGVHSNTGQKVVSQERQGLNKKQIASKENQCRTKEQLKEQIQKNDVGKPKEFMQSELPIKVDVSVQANQSEEVINDGLGSISRALLSLSAAVNRYCDIVERRIF